MPTLLDPNQAIQQLILTKLQAQDFPLQQMEILYCNMHEAPENHLKTDQLFSKVQILAANRNLLLLVKHMQLCLKES